MSRNKCYILIIIMIMALIVLGAFFIPNKYKQNKIDRIEVGDVINNKDVILPQEELFDDTIIGTLTIPSINLFDINICESVELETLSHSIGHFENTNIYEGNVGLASHNAGTNANYFANINKLKQGDEIYYKTRYGTKKYAVYEVLEIDSYDWSKLEQTENNQITLITCISNKPNSRICVIAKEF